MTPCKPIIFSGPMVRAILDGRKTQTRRVIKPQPFGGIWYRPYHHEPRNWQFATSKQGLITVYWTAPYAPGDLLWVRERLRATGNNQVVYDADDSVHPDAEWVWKNWTLPSIHCPRGLSRIMLEVTAVKVQRLQDISEDDAKAEGVERLKSGRGYYSAKHGRGAVHFGVYHDYATEAFADLWETIHGPDAWDANPWVAAYSFRRVTG